MHQIYIALGSNLGPSKELFHQTIECLKVEEMQDIECSEFHETEAVDCESDRLFLNAVVRFKTTLSKEMLFTKLEAIEQQLGKKPKAKNAARLIDIDLLFYGDIFFSNKKFTVPHPRWQERLFVVKPLTDLTSTITLSNKGFSISINIQKLLSFLSKKGENYDKKDFS